MNSTQSKFADLNVKKIVGLLLALVVCLTIVIVALSSFGKSPVSKEKPATSTSMPQSLIDVVGSRTYPISQPKAIPRGYVRTDVEVVSASRSASGCEEVLQTYRKTANNNADYIDVYSYSSECSFTRPKDAEKYTVGDYEGWVSDPSDPGKDETYLSALYELTVNQGVVRIETDMNAANAAKVLAQFVPFDAKPPSASITIGEK